VGWEVGSAAGCVGGVLGGRRVATQGGGGGGGGGGLAVWQYGCVCVI